MSARWIVADVFDGLSTLEDGSVDLIITSPPFLALRSYLPADHPDKDKEIGSESTPAEFLDVMLRVTAELRRVLAPHGSIAIELGDTYAGSGNGPDALKPSDNGAHDLWKDESVPMRKGEGWPLAKSKTLIPELFRIALAYGFNPLTGQPSPAGKWRVRNVVAWCRPNPPVGALGDKWRPATSDVVVACVSGKRYWDDLATRKAYTEPVKEMRVGAASASKGVSGGDSGNPDKLRVNQSTTGGAPLLDYWEIPPGGYKGSHYAVFPPELVVPLVKAMCPEKVCRTCGEPSRRIVKYSRPIERDDSQRAKHANGERPAPGRQDRAPEVGWEIDRETTGWTDCGCSNGHCNGDYPCDDHWRPGLVLDPFAGSGTTLAVAQGHGHDAIGIDLDERNAELARGRLGMFLEVVS